MSKRLSLSIRSKIFLAIVVISMLPLITFAVFSLNITYSNMHSQLIDSRNTSIDWLQDRLEVNIKALTDQFYGYEVNRDLKNSIIDWAYSGSMDYTDQSRMKTSFETTMSIDPTIRSIEIHSLVTENGFISTRASFYPVTGHFDSISWKSRDTAQPTNIIFDADDTDISVIHQINSFPSEDGIAVIILKIRIQTYLDILNKVKNDKRETAMLLNNDDEVLVISPGTDSEEITQEDISPRPWLQDSSQYGHMDGLSFFYRSVSSDKLKVVYAVPDNIILQTLWSTTSVGIIILALALLAAILSSAMFSQIISKPLVQLSKEMQTSNIQDVAGSVETKRRDEIGFLQESFGIMVKRNQELIAKELQINKEKRDAQIRALQAQINPHFIYNALQVLGSMALNNQSSDIYPIVVALSDIMRYSFSFSQEMTTLKNEMGYLNGYLSIQNHRFNNRIEFRINVPDEIIETYIPKLILQPIVENCFEHGFSDKSGNWKISLDAIERSGNLTITISDNGLGIPEQRVNDINNELEIGDLHAVKSSAHIGMINVNSRIRLTYGEEYGLSISSTEGSGTVVTIRMKLIERLENEVYRHFD